MKLKKYIEKIIKEDLISLWDKGILIKLLELEALENYFNAMLGIEFDIEVKPVERKARRFYGKGLEEKLNLTPHKINGDK
jgi:hypothetical protein